MKDIQFSNQIKKGLQIVMMFAILFLKFGTIGASIAYAAPSNDTFSGATPILSVPYQYNVDTTTATTAGETGEQGIPTPCNPSVPEDNHSLYLGHKTVWYQYTPTTSGTISMDTLGTNYDTYIAVWTGTALNNLALVACDDETYNDQTSLLVFSATEGVNYYIQIAQYNGYYTSGSRTTPTGGNLKFHIILGGGADTVGVFRPSDGALYLKNSNTSGFADIAINYGTAGDYPVTGDWDGNGTATIGIYRNGVFYLRNSNTIGFADIVFAFGAPGDQPIAGDWDGDGIDTVGVYRNSAITFYLRNSNTAGASDMSFSLGSPGDVGIAGDWNGDGLDTTGVFRPSNGALYLKNANTTGYADIQINYGLGGDQPVTGDWNNDGIDTIGIYRNGVFYLRDSNTIGYADLVFALGVPGDMPIAGNWDGKP